MLVKKENDESHGNTEKTGTDAISIARHLVGWKNSEAQKQFRYKNDDLQMSKFENSPVEQRKIIGG